MYQHTIVCGKCGKEYTYTTTDSRARHTRCSDCRKDAIARNAKKGLESGKRYVPREITRVCSICGQVFVYTQEHRFGYKRRYCPECAKELQRQRCYTYRVKAGLIRNPGVGRGNVKKPKGSDRDPSCYRKLAMSSIPPEDWKCYYCGATHSTSKARPNSRLALEVHHIDGDPCNNDPANWRIVCKQCHLAIEHSKKRNNANVKSRN